MRLRPFISYYGANWRAAPHYPAPAHDILIEPFAGGANYALHYPEKSVLLCDLSPVVCAVWDYLIRAPGAEILALPDCPSGIHVDTIPVCQEARWLIGFWLNNGSAAPRNFMSPWGAEKASGFWGEKFRKRISEQQAAIRHWRIVQCSYAQIPDIEATWFIDPPYEQAGGHYPYGSKQIDYAHLGTWCRSRSGQPIVCENVGADWLPFRPWREIQANSSRCGHKTSAEAIWP